MSIHHLMIADSLNPDYLMRLAENDKHVKVHAPAQHADLLHAGFTNLGN